MNSPTQTPSYLPHPGPWRWSGNKTGNGMELTDAKGNFVMTFARWGTQGAQPRFQVDGIMQDGSKMMGVPQAHNPWRLEGLAHPAAELIRLTPEFRDALSALLTATLQAKSCAGCMVEGHDGCAAAWPTVQAARALLAKVPL